MKALKILSLFTFALFLISTVSAFGIIGGAFDDGSANGVKSITINEGNSINFNYDFLSDSSPIIINIILHDSATGDIIIPFADNQKIDKSQLIRDDITGYYDYTGEKTIPSNLTPGKNYELIMSANTIGKSITLSLTIRDTTAPVITLNGNAIVTVTQGNTYTDAGATATDNVDLSVTVTSTGIVDTNTVGSYTITYTATDSSGNTATKTRTVNVIAPVIPDTTAPVITLNGNAIVTVTQGNTYTDAGATATDNVDLSVTVTSTGIVDTNTVGSYTITYTATDSSGNTATKTRTVNVVAGSGGDTTPPVITLLGSNPISVALGTTYVDAGATATDNVDLSVTVTSTGIVDTNTVGSYTITYTATDSSGNTATKTRTVNVVAGTGTDTTAPVITLLGANLINLTLGTTYTEYGATALDNVDGDITGKIIITNPVNVYALGTYIVKYNVKDTAGNSATEVTRTVNVVAGSGGDTTPPVITLLGSNPISVALGTTYVDAGATATDNVDGNITSKIVVVNPVNTSVVGIYTITYNVKDNAGNSAVEITRTVGVVSPNDTTAPVITVITPVQNKKYTQSNLTFEVKVNEIAEVEFSLDSNTNVIMDFNGIVGGVLTFTYDSTLNNGQHTIVFYVKDTAENTASKTISFSVDTSKSSNKITNTATTVINGDNLDEQLYLNQFKPKQVIYLTEDTTAPAKHLNWFQRFINWLGRLFGL